VVTLSYLRKKTGSSPKARGRMIQYRATPSREVPGRTQVLSAKRARPGVWQRGESKRTSWNSEKAGYSTISRYRFKEACLPRGGQERNNWKNGREIDKPSTQHE